MASVGEAIISLIAVLIWRASFASAGVIVMPNRAERRRAVGRPALRRDAVLRAVDLRDAAERLAVFRRVVLDFVVLRDLLAVRGFDFVAARRAMGRSPWGMKGTRGVFHFAPVTRRALFRSRRLESGASAV